MSRAKELGSSLLASKQARDDKFRKRQESWKKRQAWTELLLPPVLDAGTKMIADNALRKDRELFSSDPNAMAVASGFELANRYSTELLNTKEAIDAFGGTPSDYAYTKYAAPFMARAEAELQARGDYEFIGDAGPFKATVDKELRILADEWADSFNQAYDALQGTGTAEERAARITELSRTINPNKFFDLAFKKAQSVFGKTSKEELDAQAIDDLINSPLYQKTSNFTEFKKEFDETKNIFSAYDMADLDLGDFDPQTLSTTRTRTDNRVSSDDTLVTETWTVSTHRNTGEETETLQSREVITITPEKTAAEIGADFLKVSPNLWDLAKGSLNSSALTAFADLAKKDNIKYTNPRTMQEYNDLQDILENVLTMENAIKNPAKEAITNSIVSQVGAQAMQIQNLILNLSEDTTEKEDARKKIVQGFFNLFELQELVSQELKGIDEFILSEEKD